MRYADLLFGALALLGATSLAAQERTVTLDEAIRLSERVQPSVVQAQGQVRTSDAAVRSAWGAYLPTVSITGSGNETFSEGPSRVDPNTGQLISGNFSNRSLTSGISANVDLFTGFRRGAEIRAARAQNTAAEAGYVDARFQQRLTTTNQFFTALASRQLVAVREASVRRAEEQLKVSVARLRAGAATRSDSLRSLVTLGTARSNLLSARAELASAEANLGRLIGEAGRVQAVDDSMFYQVVVPLDTAALRAEAEERSPQVQAAVAEASAASAQLRAAKSAYWPSLNLGASTGWNASRANDYDMFNQRQLRLSLNWNVFNGFERELAIAQRQVGADIAEATAGEARRAVQAELTTRLAELTAARERIDIAQTSVVAATEDLRVQQERYRLGAATIVDVLTSQEALNQAEVDVVTARYDYLRAKAQIEALIGRDL